MTREDISKVWPVLKAFAEGKDIEFRYPSSDRWYPFEHLDIKILDYRIKPEPSYRPWKYEEVPVGVLIKNEYLRSIITACDKMALVYVGHCDDAFTVYELLGGWKYSDDNGKTWQPCGVPV